MNLLLPLRAGCRGGLGLMLGVCVALSTAAQPSSGPEFVAPPGSARTDAVVQGPVVDAHTLAQEAVELYGRTCAVASSDAGARVDLALAAGLAPLQTDDAQRAARSMQRPAARRCCNWRSPTTAAAWCGQSTPTAPACAPAF
jgi:hypothetical protein